jgi:hypothetical protein
MWVVKKMYVGACGGVWGRVGACGGVWGRVGSRCKVADGVGRVLVFNGHGLGQYFVQRRGCIWGGRGMYVNAWLELELLRIVFACDALYKVACLALLPTERECSPSLLKSPTEHHIVQRAPGVPLPAPFPIYTINHLSSNCPSLCSCSAPNWSMYRTRSRRCSSSTSCCFWIRDWRSVSSGLLW